GISKQARESEPAEASGPQGKSGQAEASEPAEAPRAAEARNERPCERGKAHSPERRAARRGVEYWPRGEPEPRRLAGQPIPNRDRSGAGWLRFLSIAARREDRRWCCPAGLL